MVDITKIKGINEEAKFIRERAFNMTLLEVFIGLRAGMSVERKTIRKLRKKLGNKIYVEAVYLLTHKLIPDEKKARKVFGEILFHQKEISHRLGRTVSIQVAALDYLQNVMSLLEKPLVMEEEKSLGIARKALPAREELLEADLKLKRVSIIHHRTVIKGISVVTGLAAGQVFKYQDVLSRELEAYDIKEVQIDLELKRLEAAMESVEKDLLHMKDTVKKQVDSSQAAIFEAHRIILKDITLLKEIEEELKSQQINVEHVVKQVFRRWEKKFKDSQSVEIQERSLDVADISRRLLKELLGIRGNALAKLSPGSVIFAKRLLPSDTVHLDRNNAKGIVTEEGGPNSHVAILANAFHIPLISKIDIDMDRITNRTPVILDGASGQIILHPTRSEKTHFRFGRAKDAKRNLALARKMSRRHLEVEGRPLTIDANVASPEECRLAKKYGCDGIGLYRIEQIYMSNPSMPTEEFLFNFLKSSLTVLKNKTATLRLLDIGGDKTLPYIDLVERTNPALGVRGIRLLLKYPHLLEIQLRVFLRLSALQRVRILVPMVTLAEDITQVLKALDQEKGKLNEKRVPFDDKIHLGAMIETPSSVLAVDLILEICDFLSIGTNDLLQYTMAAGRENMNVSGYYESGNPLVLKWVEEIMNKADRAGKDCEVCGELAGNLDYTKELLKSGVRHYSVVPHLVPGLKEKIASLV